MALFRKDKGNLYLVDFENIHDTGLVGINTLEKNDTVIILFGSQNKTIGLGSHFGVMESKAKVETIALEKSAKNYLDFQLVTYLGYLIGTGKYDKVYVVSNDTGYDSVVDFWKGRDFVVERVRAIKPELLPEKESEKTTRKPYQQKRRNNNGNKNNEPKKQEAKNQESKKQEPKKQDSKKNETKRQEAKKPAKQKQVKPEVKPEAEIKSVENKPAETKPAETKPVTDVQISEAKPAAPKSQKGKQKAAVAEIPEATRKKIRNAVKQYDIEANKYTIIYKAIALSKDTNGYKSRICSSFGDKSNGIFEATEPIRVEYQATKAGQQ